MRFSHVDPEAIRFHTTLDRTGVQIVEADEVELVNKILEKFNLTLLSSEGDFKYSSYLLDTELSEEQAEDIEAFIRAEEERK